MVETKRLPTMIVCPVCGFDPEPPAEPMSPKELMKQRLRKLFIINAENPWWIEQTEYVCQWLKNHGLNPKYILDVGCGDGRWIYGIKSVFPEAGYTGIDRLEDHYLLNKERMPEIDWVLGDFCTYTPTFNPDMIFIMGTLNPMMSKADQGRLFAKVIQLAPSHLIVLFDFHSTGYVPEPWIRGKYFCSHCIRLEEPHRGPKQNLMVWHFVRNGTSSFDPVEKPAWACIEAPK